MGQTVKNLLERPFLLRKKAPGERKMAFFPCEEKIPGKKEGRVRSLGKEKRLVRQQAPSVVSFGMKTFSFLKKKDQGKKKAVSAKGK
jgi:hypothetical protein